MLNKDHANYEINLKFVKDYLSASDKQIEKYMDKLGDGLSETVAVMGKFGKYKQIQGDLEILEHQCLTQSGDYVTRSVLIALSKEEMSIHFQLAQAYSYGLINGKRIERARRKVGTV